MKETEKPLDPAKSKTAKTKKKHDKTRCCKNNPSAGDCQEVVSFTVFTKPKGIITKRISLDESGKVKKDASECFIAQGEAETVTTTFRDLPDCLNALNKNQAVAWGISKYEKIGIVSVKRLKQNPESKSISRTKDNFYYPVGQPGVILLDNDSDIPNSKIISVISEVVPSFDKAAMFIKPSVSSCLYRKSTGEQLTGKGRAHIYVLVADASDIPRFGKILHQRLMLAGHGRVEFSKDGKILIRTLVDQYVHSQERLDFVASPVLEGDLEQRIPEIEYIDGEALDTSNLKKLSRTELIQYEHIERELREAHIDESKKIKAEYVDEEAERLTAKKGISKQKAMRIIQERTQGRLTADDILYFDIGEEITVREVRRNPDKYDGCTLADPAEPDYGGGRCKAILYANKDTGIPIIFSHAHGGRTYQLLPDYDELKELIGKMGDDELRDGCWIELFAHATINAVEHEELLKKLQSRLDVPINTLRQSVKGVTADAVSAQYQLKPRYKTGPADYLNLKYGCCLFGAKTVIIEESYDDGLKSWIFITYRPQELKQFYQNKRIRLSNNKIVQVFDFWMKSETRNTFLNVVFKPNAITFRTGKRTIQQGGAYNLWQGYTVRSVQGECTLIMDHIFYVWCSGDVELFEYVLNWLADMFQHPDRQGKTALVLPSKQGAGKGIILEGVIAKIFGCHALVATRKEDFLGRFNSQLGQSVFVFVNEAVWAGEKEKQGTLKALITDEYLTIEKKYLDSVKFRNKTHLIFASNEGWVAPADVGDRRFMYLPVSDERKGDNEYFKQLAHQIENGGREAFLYEMLNRNLSGVDLTQMPKKQGQQKLIDQLQTANVHIRFLFDILSNPDLESYITGDKYTLKPLYPTLPEDWDMESLVVTKDHFYEMYQMFCKSINYRYPVIRDILFRCIKKDVQGMLDDTKRKIGKKPKRCVKLPVLDDARNLFCDKTGLNVDWSDS